MLQSLRRGPGAAYWRRGHTRIARRRLDRPVRGVARHVRGWDSAAIGARAVCRGRRRQTRWWSTRSWRSSARSGHANSVSSPPQSHPGSARGSGRAYRAGRRASGRELELVAAGVARGPRWTGGLPNRRRPSSACVAIQRRMGRHPSPPAAVFARGRRGGCGRGGRGRGAACTRAISRRRVAV